MSSRVLVPLGAGPGSEGRRGLPAPCYPSVTGGRSVRRGGPRERQAESGPGGLVREDRQRQVAELRKSVEKGEGAVALNASPSLDRRARLLKHGLDKLIDENLHTFLELQVPFGSLADPDDLPRSDVDDSAGKPDTGDGG